MTRRLPPPWSVKEQAACRSPHWVKVKNPNAPTVTREAEEDGADNQ